jgi:3-hydroxyacyl-CoA dehydrogenase/3a,7a,12a-trihydroxy-5b-cholest-24-enoyl-CoA hydratase
VRGAGGWGGERGPSGDINVPPAREPDAVIEEKTDANQALLYRLSGDWNPLHADPAFAKAFGFERPILHGLCTYGHVARHVIKSFCGNDPRKFKSIKVRFAESVFPGETLITRMWKESETRVMFETKVKERDKLVIKNAAVELYAQIPQRQAAAKPAAAGAPAAQPAGPTSADIFAVIGKHLQANKGLGDQIKTVFQFKLSGPDSAWHIDLKSGDGAVKQGQAEKPDVTLELADADFVGMCTGQADPNKLYFGGKMKVTGNVMASQKLAFLQKIDPKLVGEVMKSRAGGAGAKPATAAEAKAAAPKAAQSGAVFAALAAKLKADPQLVKGLAGQVLQFKISAPEASWLLDLSGAAPKLEQNGAGKPAASFTIADEDLAMLAAGKAAARDLYQRGKLRVDGETRLVRQLGLLSGLI